MATATTTNANLTAAYQTASSTSKDPFNWPMPSR